MATIIKDKSGACVSQSHNLRAMLRGASLYGGVVRLDVKPRTLPGGVSLSADVVAHYTNGYTAETIFVCHSHAVEWAWNKSERKGTHFSGCDVRAPGTPLDEFTRAYMVAALWSSNHTDGEHAGEPLDSVYSIDDISDEWRAQAIADCRDFQRAKRVDLAKAYELYGTAEDPHGYAGHDFWLTRNRHGAGFWDRGLLDVGDRLAEAARLCGTVEIDEHDMKGSQP